MGCNFFDSLFGLILNCTATAEESLAGLTGVWSVTRHTRTILLVWMKTNAVFLLYKWMTIAEWRWMSLLTVITISFREHLWNFFVLLALMTKGYQSISWLLLVIACQCLHVLTTVILQQSNIRWWAVILGQVDFDCVYLPWRGALIGYNALICSRPVIFGLILWSFKSLWLHCSYLILFICPL